VKNSVIDSVMQVAITRDVLF